MPKFHELVNQLRNPGNDETGAVPESIYDDLTGEYDNLFSGSIESTKQRDERIAALEAENSNLKSKNYDLLMSVASAPTEVEETTDDDKEPSIESLFVRKGK